MRVIFARWATDLIRQGNHWRAVEILLSLHLYKDVLQTLYEDKQFHTALMFYRALEEQNLLPVNAPSPIACLPNTSLAALYESICLV
jgi:hypothetical protein